jgi:hypothetical protein
MTQLPLPRRRLLLASLAWPWPVLAQSTRLMVEGQAFERQAIVAGAALRLNGTGVREVSWFKGYVAGLYLPARATTAAQALAMPGPKRLQLRMLQTVPAAEFVKAFNKGMARNAGSGEVERLAARMGRFESLITQTGKAHKGDIIDLDLDPAAGTRFGLNGRPRGEVIPGADFYAALLRAFVGERPYDEKLKSGLLGGA